jgi:hypothetical protein
MMVNSMRSVQDLGIRPFIQADIPPTATLADILALETRFKIRLPEDYKQFLLSANGGYPQLDRFRPHGRAEVWDLNDFFHLSPNAGPVAPGLGWGSNLWHQIATWRKTLGTSAVPFASTGGGEPIFFDLSSEPASVWLLAHDPDEHIFVARSFTTFLDELFASTA